MKDLEIVGLDEKYEEPDLEGNKVIWKRVKINRELTDEEKEYFGWEDLFNKGVSLNRPIQFVNEPKDKNRLIGYSEKSEYYIKFAILKNSQTNSKQEELDSQIKSIKTALNEINKLRKNG